MWNTMYSFLTSGKVATHSHFVPTLNSQPHRGLAFGIGFAREEPGPHRLRIHRVDPGAVLQKIVIDTGNLKPSYLGPPESLYQR